ncbi:MAG: hypothetical protein EOP06_28485, partial [Proteobacteria bacterium]
MRWLPLPTCRIPLRRYIASLTIAALVLPMFAVPLAQAEGGNAAPPSSDRATNMLCELKYNEDGSVPTDQDKFNNWKNVYGRISVEHRKASPDTAKDAIAKLIVESKKNPPLVPEAEKRQQLYLDALIKTAQYVCPAYMQASKGIKAIAGKIEARNALAKTEACKINDAKELNEQAEKAVKLLDEAFDKKSREIRKYHEDYGRYDAAAIKAEDEVDTAVPLEQQQESKARVSALENERLKTWGNDEEVNSPAKGSIHDKTAKAFFTTIVQMFDKQRQTISQLRVNLHTNVTTLTKSAEGCKTESNVATEGGVKQVPPAAAAVKEGNTGGDSSTIKGGCTVGSNAVDPDSRE